jgi:nitrite reductase (NO-forming)/hydroxylamine reductase
LIAAGACGAAIAETDPDGRDTYLKQCARCHQRDGRGIEDVYPDLRNARELWTQRARLIQAILGGRSGPLEIDGQSFDNTMPTHGYLSNETVAATLTYLQNAWGPAGAPYTTEEVAAQRLKLLEDHPTRLTRLPNVSPLARMEAEQYVTTKGPPISVDDFAEARSLYYGHCTGCHGVLRQGTAGNPLTPELMRERGTEYLKSVMNYGSSSGMPNWGTSDTLTGKNIQLLALFLQHPIPQPPDMDQAEVRASWTLLETGQSRPNNPQHNYDLDQLFVVALHDLGQVAIIDGESKQIIATIDAGASPNRVRASASGRYLYVISRDGTLSSIDLYSDPPRRTAHVRIGYEARAVGASRHPDYVDRFVLAGAYWPPQLVLLDGQTLEPLRLISTRSTTVGTRRYHPEPRVTDIAGSFERPEFVANIKETGHIYLFPYDDYEQLNIVDVDASRELRAGRFALGRRYYLTPADVNAVAVVDTRTQRLAAQVPADVFGAGPGVSFEHPDLGPVWMTSSPLRSELIVIGTDPEAHPESAWRQLAIIEGPGTGSMFMATHPRSENLWVDTPLSGKAISSQSIAVYDKSALDKGYRTLPVAAWAELGEGPKRVLQPTYNQKGDEVWMVVWNPQDLNSAIVVVDDKTLALKAVIADPRIITPTRIFSVAQLKRGG